MRRINLTLFLLLLGCQRSPANQDAPPVVSGGAASRLEQAAIASGTIADPAKISPVGLFQRTHEAGRDALCVIPARNGELHFGLEAIFGEEPACRGQGTARRAGDKLILSFKGGYRCIIVAQYDGDQVALPGVVDLACADLCEGRGSLEGVSFPRIASDAASALRARERSGDPLCTA